MNKKSRIFIIIGGLLGALGVIMGAFGAHGIKGFVEPHLFDAWLTGAHYQLIHAVFILFVGMLMERRQRIQLLVWAAALSTVGTVCFSGSIYVLVLTPLKVGWVTPLGGLLFVSGWLLLVFNFLRKSQS